MEDLFLLKEILQKNDYICKIDLKDAYFAVPPHSSSQKYIRFKWKGNLYQFLCLCFVLSSASRVFTKLMKIPISVIGKWNVRLIIFLEDLLITASTKKELIQARDTLIFDISSSNFGVFDQQKQIRVTTMPDFTVSRCGNKFERNEFITSQDKKDKVISQCQGILKEKSVSIRELTQVLVSLSSTVIAVSAAPIQY